jgi:hypothetical protein
MFAPSRSSDPGSGQSTAVSYHPPYCRLLFMHECRVVLTLIYQQHLWAIAVTLHGSEGPWLVPESASRNDHQHHPQHADLDLA